MSSEFGRTPLCGVVDAVVASHNAVSEVTPNAPPVSDATCENIWRSVPRDGCSALILAASQSSNGARRMHGGGLG